MSIKEYINLMKKNTYLFSKCSICGLEQNKTEGIRIFSYCIKCDEIICSECVSKHIEKDNEKHPNLRDTFIIKNNERGIKCLCILIKTMSNIVLIVKFIYVMNV